MNKLNSLSKEQIDLMHKKREEALRLFFNDKSYDKDKAESLVYMMYKLAGLKTPTIIHLSSPIAMQYAANMVRAQVRDQVGDQVWAQVRDQVWDQVGAQVGAQVGDQVRDQVWAQVGDQVWAQVGDQVRDQVWDQVWAQVRAQVRDQVRDQVWAQVRDQVWAQVGAQVRDQELIYFYSAYRGTVSDMDWIVFYQFFQEIGVLGHDLFKKYGNLVLESGIFMMIQLKDVCFCCKKPDFTYRDEQNRMHCEDGPSIGWDDGYELYYWHGTCLPKEYIMHEITRKTISSERNAEKRRCLYEIVGHEKYMDLIDVEKIDTDVSRGQLYELYKSKEVDDVAGDHLFFVKVICPSSERVYVHGVPPATTALQAVAWMFGETEQTYNPLIES